MSEGKLFVSVVCSVSILFRYLGGCSRCCFWGKNQRYQLHAFKDIGPFPPALDGPEVSVSTSWQGWWQRLLQCPRLCHTVPLSVAIGGDRCLCNAGTCSNRNRTETFFSSPILSPSVLYITNRLREGNNFVRADLDLLATENGFKPPLGQ